MWPAATSDFVRFVAMVLSTASPIAPAICCDTLTTPDPNPASSLGISDMPICSSGMNESPAPAPTRRKPKKTWGK